MLRGGLGSRVREVDRGQDFRDREKSAGRLRGEREGTSHVGGDKMVSEWSGSGVVGGLVLVL